MSKFTARYCRQEDPYIQKTASARTEQDMFSHRGEPVTVFEMRLVNEAPQMGAAEKTSEKWVALAKRIGIDNMVMILDALGTEKVHVPTREEFFAALYRPVRNRQMFDLRFEAKKSLREIGKLFNLSHKAVALALESVTAE